MYTRKDISGAALIGIIGVFCAGFVFCAFNSAVLCGIFVLSALGLHIVSYEWVLRVSEIMNRSIIYDLPLALLVGPPLSFILGGLFSFLRPVREAFGGADEYQDFGDAAGLFAIWGIFWAEFLAIGFLIYLIRSLLYIVFQLPYELIRKLKRDLDIDWAVLKVSLATLAIGCIFTTLVKLGGDVEYKYKFETITQVEQSVFSEKARLESNRHEVYMLSRSPYW